MMLRDLSVFDYVFEYMPGDKNELGDLISRIPGCDNVSDRLSKGLMKGKECKGRGDSMFDCVLYGLQDLIKDGFVERVPGSVRELRNEVLGKVMKRPEQIKLEKVCKYMKEFTAMNDPGVISFQEVLIVVRCLRFWCVCVCVCVCALWW